MHTLISTVISLSFFLSLFSLPPFSLFPYPLLQILDIVPKGIHDKCPVIIGCTRDVDLVMGFYK